MIFPSLKHRVTAAFVRRRDDRLGMACTLHIGLRESEEEADALAGCLSPIDLAWHRRL
jgi:hypothetical protein